MGENNLAFGLFLLLFFLVSFDSPVTVDGPVTIASKLSCALVTWSRGDPFGRLVTKESRVRSLPRPSWPCPILTH